MTLRHIISIFLEDRLARIGLLLLALFVGAAVLAPWLSPHDPHRMFDGMLPPSRDHLLGTNDLGYDLFAELLQGARYSLALAASAAVVSTLIGAVLGVVAGYYRGAGFVLMRLVDVFLAVPRFPLIVLIAAFARPGFLTLFLFFVLFGWPSVARIVRARILTERQQEYVLAAHAIGAPGRRIMLRHLLPASLPVAFVRFVAEMQHVIMAEAGLSFMGLGNPTTRSWGMTLSYASRYPALLITDVWQWWVLPPGLAITLICLALAFLGLGLERVSNPRLRAAAAPAGIRKSTENRAPRKGTTRGWTRYARSHQLEREGLVSGLVRLTMRSSAAPCLSCGSSRTVCQDTDGGAEIRCIKKQALFQ
ncbi:MAG TPA: ABC transporter permease [Anaerolineae bacterium]|nr:ABC transporter permease [Anaerolineae bacterium]HPL30017.1 ABC transporter permease [Anaerolineae bacterium]